ncbi:hypothetical protein P3G55_20730 [Leptospira sp. 96542]|nr:hypothetical protein [Leptospira sp. 96542]
MDWSETLQGWGGKAVDAYLAGNPTNVSQPNPNGTTTNYTEGQPAGGGFMAGSGKWLLIGGGVLVGLVALYFVAKD